ncbi:MAG: CU044_2847 family protein [Thermoanaerobaculia bacterium]
MPSKDVVVIQLENGATALVEAVRGSAERLVGDTEIRSDFRKILPAITGICTELKGIMETVSPRKASVKFGFSLSVESEGLIALICKGSAESTFEVTLEW